MSLAIVIPFFNEERNLIKVIDEWEESLKKIDLQKKFFFINDGSTDNSINIIKNKTKSKFIIINTNRLGAGQACLIGYEQAIKEDYDLILQIDADGQCDPKFFEYFYNKVHNFSNKIIIGHRYKREDGFLRLLTSVLLSISIYIKTGIFVIDSNCPYRLIKKDTLKQFLEIINNNEKYKRIYLINVLMSVILKKNKIKISFIKIIFKKRYYGNSHFNYGKMFKLFKQLIDHI